MFVPKNSRILTMSPEIIEAKRVQSYSVNYFIIMEKNVICALISD